MLLRLPEEHLRDLRNSGKWLMGRRFRANRRRSAIPCPAQCRPVWGPQISSPAEEVRHWPTIGLTVSVKELGGYWIGAR